MIFQVFPSHDEFVIDRVMCTSFDVILYLCIWAKAKERQRKKQLPEENVGKTSS
jgi:hypothetical protein